MQNAEQPFDEGARAARRREPPPEPAAEFVFDPAGPPVPVTGTAEFAGPGLMTSLLTVIAGSGVLLTMCSLTTQRCAGATRSARIEWERRQAQIEQAIAADEALWAEPAEPRQGKRTTSDE
jgi:hypothetical protein